MGRNKVYFPWRQCVHGRVHLFMYVCFCVLVCVYVYVFIYMCMRVYVYVRSRATSTGVPARSLRSTTAWTGSCGMGKGWSLGCLHLGCVPWPVRCIKCMGVWDIVSAWLETTTITEHPPNHMHTLKPCRFAAFGDYRRHPWILQLANKLLSNDTAVRVCVSVSVSVCLSVPTSRITSEN